MSHHSQTQKDNQTERGQTSFIRRWLAAGILSLGLLALAIFIQTFPSLESNVIAGPNSGMLDFPINNKIDSFIVAKLKEENLQPAKTCTDSEFLRRVYIDIVGVIPSRIEAKQFLNSKDPKKREKLVDLLLKDERYGMHWAVLWGDMLREQSSPPGNTGTIRNSYRNWLRDALNSNMPYDQFVTKLITSKGTALEDGATNFYLRDGQERVETVNTIASVFMGTRMSCAQCHDHPFDSWEQQDFHHLMAFLHPRTAVVIDTEATLEKMLNDPGLAPEMEPLLKKYLNEVKNEGPAKDRLAQGKNNSKGKPQKRQRPRNYLNEIRSEVEKKFERQKAAQLLRVFNNSRINRVIERPIGEYRMPGEDEDQSLPGRKGEVLKATWPWDKQKVYTGKGNRREVLAQFLTEDRQFLEVQVNRIWAQMFGYGIVNPVDDFRKRNPPSNSELLKYLADEFHASGFDNKHMIRLIANSSTYQRSTASANPKKLDREFFSHQKLRRMTAEQLYDSVMVATGQKPGVSLLEDRTATLASQREMGGKKKQDYAEGSGEDTADDMMMGAKNRSEKGLPYAVDINTPSRTGSFLSDFNQPDRDHILFERDSEGTVTQALTMLNSKFINESISYKKDGLAKQIIDAKLSPQAATVELYLAILSRYPTQSELRVGMLVFRTQPAKGELVEDYIWALLNSREFMFIR